MQPYAITESPCILINYFVATNKYRKNKQE